MQTYTPSGGLSPASGPFVSLLPAIAPKSFKQALGDEIERMIDLMDQLDGDTDLELDWEHVDGNPDDEPSLGSLNVMAPSGFTSRRGPYISQVRWAGGGCMDAELDDCDLEDSHDREASDLAGDANANLEDDTSSREPSLGSLDAQLNQEHWTSTNDSPDACNDRELDDCDREDGGDTEMNGDESDGPDYREIFRPMRHPAIVAPACGAPLPEVDRVLGRIRVDFPLHPQAIAVTTEGDCLKPDVLSGDTLIIEPVLPEPGELACFWPVGGGKPFVKYLVSSLQHLFPHNPRSEIVLHVRVRMLNPPKHLGMRADQIERIWRVARVLPQAEVVRV